MCANNVACGQQKYCLQTVGSTLSIKLEMEVSYTQERQNFVVKYLNGTDLCWGWTRTCNDHDGIMVLDETLKVGTPIIQVFDLNTDTIIDICNYT